MTFPIHRCDPSDPCPVLAGSACEGPLRRIYGEGKPGARPCLWPDEEAPYDWDDPAVCRLPAVKGVRFEGAQRAVPTCASCLEALKEGRKGRPCVFTLESVT